MRNNLAIDSDGRENATVNQQLFDNFNVASPRAATAL